MASAPSAQVIEQEVVRVPNNDTDINAEIADRAPSGWAVTLLLVSGSDMVILFSRQYVAV